MGATHLIGGPLDGQDTVILSDRLWLTKAEPTMHGCYRKFPGVQPAQAIWEGWRAERQLTQGPLR